MDYNTIPLRRKDIDRRPYLYDKFVHGNISPDEIVELRRILENEKYLALREGNMFIFYSIASMLNAVDEYVKLKGISPSSDFKVSMSS
jgi:hypothetical protein